MSATLYIEGLGRAARCDGAKHHTPKPRRYVWHHILPQVCGGKTVEANLVQLCDNCHYSVHDMLWHLKQTGFLPKTGGTAQQKNLAAQGYGLALRDNVINLIPNEGGAE